MSHLVFRCVRRLTGNTLKNPVYFHSLNFSKFSFFRISPAGAAVQHTIRCDYRNAVTKATANGKEVKYGMYPTVIQSKYRIDEKRPLAKDGKEKQPWSK